MTKTNPLRVAADGFVRASMKRQIIRGLIGRTSTDTPAQCVVANNPTFLHVRVGGGDTYSPGRARNKGNVAVRTNTPIEMVLNPDDHEYVIIGYDLSGGRWAAATGGDTLNQFGVTQHTHKIGTGLEYEIESERMEPGRVHADTHNMIATVNGFRHALGTFETATVDLVSLVPGAGLHRWVLLGVDPSANVAVAVGGTAVILATALVDTDLDAIPFSGYIPLGAFGVADTTTALATYAQDARIWFDTPGVSVTVDDTVIFDDDFVFFEGEPVTWP